MSYQYDPERPRRMISTLGSKFYADEWRGGGDTLRRTRKGPLRDTRAEAEADKIEWDAHDALEMEWFRFDPTGGKP